MDSHISILIRNSLLLRDRAHLLATLLVACLSLEFLLAPDLHGDKLLLHLEQLLLLLNQVESAGSLGLVTLGKTLGRRALVLVIFKYPLGFLALALVLGAHDIINPSACLGGQSALRTH